MIELNNKFKNLVLKLQELNKPYFGYEDMPINIKKKIDKIGKQILKEDLIDKCGSKHFAIQLMIKNNVPKKYWEEGSKKIKLK